MHRQNLGQMLIAANLIDEVQMQIALSEQKRTGKRFGSTLVEMNFIDENVLAAFLSKQIDVPCISLLHIDIPKKVLRKIPRSVAALCKAVPVRMDGERLEVAMLDPTDLEVLEKLEREAGCFGFTFSAATRGSAARVAAAMAVAILLARDMARVMGASGEV